MSCGAASFFATGLTRPVLLALVLGALWGPAYAEVGGQLKSARVKFHTEPAAAQIYLVSIEGGQEFLGRASDVCVVPAGKRLRLELRADGYHSEEIVLEPNHLDPGKQLNRWPPKEGEVIKLHRDIPQWFYPLLGAGLLGAGLGAGWWFNRKPKTTQAGDSVLTELDLPALNEVRGSLALKRLGRYHLISVIGEGGMASVYRAFSDSKEEVAIKVMRRELSNDPEYRARFEREIQVSCGLNHPGIVRLIDWGDEQGTLYLVMELVDGQTLRELLEQGLEDAQAARYLIELLQAVAFAHQQGVVHRDLKPDNIMVTRKGHLKVMDFGLARDERTATITQSGVALGTPAYMSPEQVQSAPPSPATDQYALGMIAYEMLGRRHPFAGEQGYQVIFKHITDIPAPVTEFRPELPVALNDILLKMVAKEPGQRYSDLKEAAEALEQVFWPKP